MLTLVRVLRRLCAAAGERAEEGVVVEEEEALALAAPAAEGDMAAARSRETPDTAPDSRLTCVGGEASVVEGRKVVREDRMAAPEVRTAGDDTAAAEEEVEGAAAALLEESMASVLPMIWLLSAATEAKSAAEGAATAVLMPLSTLASRVAAELVAESVTLLLLLLLLLPLPPLALPPFCAPSPSAAAMAPTVPATLPVLAVVRGCRATGPSQLRPTPPRTSTALTASCTTLGLLLAE